MCDVLTDPRARSTRSWTRGSPWCWRWDRTRSSSCSMTCPQPTTACFNSPHYFVTSIWTIYIESLWPIYYINQNWSLYRYVCLYRTRSSCCPSPTTALRNFLKLSFRWLHFMPPWYPRRLIWLCTRNPTIAPLMRLVSSLIRICH